MNTISNIRVNLIPDDCPDVSYLEQDEFQDRLEAYNRGSFYYVGIKATAEIVIPVGDLHILQTITSGGLWGIESDSGEEYIRETADEEIKQLYDILQQLNVDVSDFTRHQKTALDEL